MKTVNIYILDFFNGNDRMSEYAYYLNYKDCVIKRVGKKKVNSRHELCIEALKCALDSMKESCKIVVYSTTDLELNKLKSHDKDCKKLLLDIVHSAINSGHILCYNLLTDMEQLIKWETLYGSNKQMELNKEQPLTLDEVFYIPNQESRTCNSNENYKDDCLMSILSEDINLDLMGPSQSDWLQS